MYSGKIAVPPGGGGKRTTGINNIYKKFNQNCLMVI
jgi:hypothetical protein